MATGTGKTNLMAMIALWWAVRHPDLALSFDRLFASDLQGRARAYRSMVGTGQGPGVPDARRQAGLTRDGLS